MEHYVGLDVSLKLTAICIVDRTGKIEREGVVSSDPEAIAEFIKSHALHVERRLTHGPELENSQGHKLPLTYVWCRSFSACNQFGGLQVVLRAGDV